MEIAGGGEWRPCLWITLSFVVESFWLGLGSEGERSGSLIELFTILSFDLLRSGL